MTKYKAAIRKLRESEPGIAMCSSHYFARCCIGQEPCDLTMSGKFHPTFTGWILSKGSDLTAGIDKALNKLKTTGWIDRVMDKWVKGKCNGTSGADRVAVVTFGTIVFGLVLSMTSLY